MKQPCAYILECSDGTYYVGSTIQLQQRLMQHESGCVPGYTSSRLPVILIFSREFPTLAEAAAAEQQLKGWSHTKKKALIDGDIDLLRELAACRNETHSGNYPGVD